MIEMMRFTAVTVLFTFMLISCGEKDSQKKISDVSNIVFDWSEESGIKNKQHDLTQLDIKSININGNRLLINENIEKKLNIGSQAIENDRVQFTGVYPNASEPDFILVESGSFGNCCPWTNYHLIIKENGKLKLIAIPTNTVTHISAMRSNEGKYSFKVKYKSGEDSSGDPKYGYMTLGDNDAVFLKQGISGSYPGIASINYGSEIFASKELRSLIFKLSDEEIREIRSQMQMETSVSWLDGSALLLCSVPIKGEWDTAQIIVIDLENKSYEIQRFINGKINFIKKIGNIRDSIRTGFEYSGKCFNIKYQNVGIGK
jgi:hypothetical protein